MAYYLDIFGHIEKKKKLFFRPGQELLITALSLRLRDNWLDLL